MKNSQAFMEHCWCISEGYSNYFVKLKENSLKLKWNRKNKNKLIKKAKYINSEVQMLDIYVYIN